MVPQEIPTQRNFILRWIGGAVLKCMGWKVRGEFPRARKAVLIAAPHTSNWDFVIGIAAKFYLELKISWLGKHTLFRKPFDPFFRWLGGVPVRRTASSGIVQQTVEEFHGHDQFLLGLSPEGTRKRVEKWKTGFYQIARGANVPIIPVAFDYGKKTILIGEAMLPSEIDADFGRLKSFYSGVRGKHPDSFNYEITS